MPLSPILSIDVKDYGATGNGVTDDSAAIQAAIAAIPYNITDEGGVFVCTTPTLYFPPGKYVIGSTIIFGETQSVVNVVGDNAIFIPKTGFTDWAFNVQRAYKFKISGLIFLNFTKGVLINNETNLNTSQVFIEECNFQQCTEVALQLSGGSSIRVVEKCKFFMNTKAMIIYGGEKVVVKDNWISSSNMEGVHPCQIENYALLHFETNLLEPQHPINAVEPAWINNYGSVVVEDVRQGGESGSFTLINNFAGNAPITSGHEPHSIIVKNSQCYAVFGNSTLPPGMFQPAVLRYVEAIPNLTSIRNNTGLLDCSIVDFSYTNFHNDPILINNMIANSGPSQPGNVCVEVENNVGGMGYAHNSFVPLELYPFLRGEDSKWPSQKPSIDLKVLDVNISGADIIYKFEYPFVIGSNLIDTTPFMISYSGNPHPGSSTAYGGVFVGIMKANGFFSGSEVSLHLLLDTITNEISAPYAGFPVPGTFDVSLYWDESGTPDMPNASSNHIFYIKISGRGGNTDDYDRISVLPLFSL